MHLFKHCFDLLVILIVTPSRGTFPEHDPPFQVGIRDFGNLNAVRDGESLRFFLFSVLAWWVKYAEMSFLARFAQDVAPALLTVVQSSASKTRIDDAESLDSFGVGEALEHSALG